MSLQPAAHVGHPVSHHSQNLQLAVAAIGILCTVVVIVLATPEAIAAATVGETGALVGDALAANLPRILLRAGEQGTKQLLKTAITRVTFAGNLASAADIPSKALDQLLPIESGAGVIASGFPRVLLGAAMRPAARAKASDTMTAKCHVERVFEGSSTVLIGPGVAPMSRRGDHIGPKCGGTISGGLQTVLVGGAPSGNGVAPSEKDMSLLAHTKVVADALSGISGLVRAKNALDVRGLMTLSAAGLGATGNTDAAKVVKMLAQSPLKTGSWMDAAGAAKALSTSYKGLSVIP